MHATLLRCSLLAISPLFATTSAVAQGMSPLGWSGWVRCDVVVRGPGYADQQVHTWTMPGWPPKTEGAASVYPAAWSVVGSGRRLTRQGGQSLDVQWTTNVPSMSAPLAIFARASDGRLLVQAWHGQLRAPRGIAGYQQQWVDGRAQRPAVVALEAFEWAFPVIELPPGKGSATQPVNGSVGPMQPAGSQGTASCTWHFGQGASAPAMPPAPTARAAPVPPAR